jgi:hypothetical protein
MNFLLEFAGVPCEFLVVCECISRISPSSSIFDSIPRPGELTYMIEFSFSLAPTYHQQGAGGSSHASLTETGLPSVSPCCVSTCLDDGAATARSGFLRSGGRQR